MTIPALFLQMPSDANAAVTGGLLAMGGVFMIVMLAINDVVHCRPLEGFREGREARLGGLDPVL
jgi:hypothetical protein